MKNMQSIDPMYNIKQVISENGYILHGIKGVSMRPLLDEATDIVKLIAAPDKLSVYDIALYEHGGQYILHRVLKVLDDGSYIICGDNLTVREYVRPEQILAVAEGYFSGEEYFALRDDAGPIVDPGYLEALDRHRKYVLLPHPVKWLRRKLSPLYHRIKGDRR